jgi:hypothetical protein
MNLKEKSLAWVQKSHPIPTMSRSETTSRSIRLFTDLAL